MIKLIVVAAGVILLAGCASVPNIADSSCKWVRPINGSVKDTVETKRQIVKHNKAWDAVCG